MAAIRNPAAAARTGRLGLGLGLALALGLGLARLARLALVGLLALLAPAVSACEAGEPLRIAGATPPHGPLVGGSTITLAGAGFAAPGAGPVRVLIAGRAAPLATATDDATLQVVIPPGERPGDAEIVVLTDRDAARATGVFRYSAPPTIDAVAPEGVLFSSTSTRVTVTGSGFLDEDAGEVTVALGDQLATDVVVESDTQLRFTAPAGRALAEPDLVVADRRGTAIHTRSLRYLPSARAGLLLFPKVSSQFAVFFDPEDRSTVSIPWAITAATRFTAVVRDERGAYWAYDRSLWLGRLDLSSQRFAGPMRLANLFPTLARHGDAYFALDRSSMRLGRLDLPTGAFTPIGTATVPCCGSYGLASDGARLYLTARQGASVVLYTIDPATGALGTPVPVTGAPGLFVEEMRFFAGRLYAANRDGTLVTIDPATAVATPLPGSVGRHGAMEVFDPDAPR